MFTVDDWQLPGQQRSCLYQLSMRLLLLELKEIKDFSGEEISN